MAVTPSPPPGCPGLTRPARSSGVRQAHPLTGPNKPRSRRRQLGAPMLQTAREASAHPPEPSPPPHPQVGGEPKHRGSGRSGGRREARSRVRTHREAGDGAHGDDSGAAWRGHCKALARVFRCPAGAEPAAPQRLSTAPPPPMGRRGRPLNANGRGSGACALGARRGSHATGGAVLTVAPRGVGVAPGGGRAGARTSRGRGCADGPRLLEAARRAGELLST